MADVRGQCWTGGAAPSDIQVTIGECSWSGQCGSKLITNLHASKWPGRQTWRSGVSSDSQSDVFGLLAPASYPSHSCLPSSSQIYDYPPFYKGKRLTRKPQQKHGRPYLAALKEVSSSSDGDSASKGRKESAASAQRATGIHFAVLQNVGTASLAAIADPVMSIVDTVTLQGVQEGLLVATCASVAVGALAAGLLRFYGQPLLLLMGTNADMLPPALSYLNIRAYAVPAALLLLVYQSAHRSVQDLRTPCLVVLACGALNAVLDPLLVFTVGWGVAGASLATTFSQWVGVFAFFILIAHNQSFMSTIPDGNYPLARRWRALMAGCVSFLQQCAGLAARATTIIAIYSLSAVAALRLGTVQAAAHQLVEQLQVFQLTILWAFLEVAQAMMVNVLGSAGSRAGRRLADTVIGWCLLSSLLLAGATWAARGLLAQLFSPDAAVLASVQQAMLPCCAMLFMGWNNALEGVLLGMGDMGFVVACFMPAAGAGIAMMLYSMWKGMGLHTIWWALTLYYTLLTLEYSARYWYLRQQM